MGYRDEIGAAVNWDGGRIEAAASLRDAIRKIIETDVAALVVMLDGQVTGVVTDMDVLKYVVEKRDLDKTGVSEIMTACALISNVRSKVPCVQLHETETVENAMRVMEVAGVHNLLVSGDNDAKFGMLSIRDLLRLL
jgi:predicted transcriptional regulator